ncbi:MAG: hypothetical protein ACLFTT_17405 [Candidatus Hydrogenedentota bacterium]
MHNAVTYRAEDRRPWSRRDGLALLGLLLLAALLRCWNLADESVWFDEYNSIAELDAPSLGAYFERSRHNDETVPLYFACQYYWAQYVSASNVGLRMLPVLFGLTSVAVVFMLSRRLFGSAAACVATLLFVLSPAQIFYAQGIRMYALTVLLGLACAWTFAEMLAGGKRRWWALNVVCNVLLLHTHLFGCWLVLTEGLVLLLTRWRRWPHLIAWGMAQVVLLTPLAWHVFHWSFDPVTGVLPPPIVLVEFWGGIDLTPLDWLVFGMPAEAASAYLPFWLVPAFQGYEALRTALRALVLLALAGALVMFWRRHCAAAALGNTPRPPDRGAEPSLYPATASFLAAWLLAPPLLLYIFAYAWSPEAFQARYVLYAAPAMNLLVGRALTGFSRAWLRRLGLAALALLYAVSAALAVQLPLRNNYRGAVNQLAAHEAPGPVMFYPAMFLPTFLRNWPEAPPAITGEHNFHELLFRMEQQLGAAGRVHVVLKDDIDFVSLKTPEAGAPAALEAYGRLRDIQLSKRVHWGPQSILVYTGRPGESYMSLTTPAGIERLRAHLRAGKGQIAHWLAAGAALEHQEAWREAIAVYTGALDQLVAAHAHDDELAETRGVNTAQMRLFINRLLGATLMQLAPLLDAHGTAETLASVTHKARAVAPDQPEVLQLTARNHRAQGNIEAARDTYLQLIDKNPWYAAAYWELDTLYEVQGLSPAERATRWQAMAEKHPMRGAAHFQLGRALEAGGKLEEACTAYARAAELMPMDPTPSINQGRVALLLERPGEAVAALQQSLAINPEQPFAQVELVRAFAAAGDIEAARSQAARCRDRDIALPPELAEELERP